jgi:formylglycine-generating enzyme required for sulfatase activity
MMVARPAAAEDLKPFSEKLPGGTVTLDMVPVPAGSVTLPDVEHPGQTKTVAIKPFYLGKTEVMWEQMDIFVYRLDLTDKEVVAGVDAANRPSTPYVPPDRGFGHEGFAAISLSFLNASKFCEWLSKKTGKHYRLPTEAEWVYAATCGQAYKPMSADELDKVAWYAGNSDEKPHEVGSKAANAWGLFDMPGNVRQYVVGMDGKPVAMGGGFADDVAGAQILSRHVPTPDWQHTDPQNPKSKWWLSDAPWAGFRVLCEAGG